MKGFSGISALGAVLFGAGSYLVLSVLQIEDALLYALVAAALFFLILSAVLRTSLAKKNQQFKQLEQQLQLQYFHKTKGDFDDGKADVKSGNIYFCESGIFCLNLNEKPYGLDRIEKEQIARIDADDVHLRIMTWDGRRYILTLSGAQAVRHLLQTRSW